MLIWLLFGVGEPSPEALIVGRVGGAGLLAIGVASWLALDDRDSRSQHGLLWGMLIYNVGAGVVFLVSLAERLFYLYRETGELSAALSKLWAGKDFHHFLAMNLCLGLSFLIYNCFAEIDRHLAEGRLRRLFFSR